MIFLMLFNLLALVLPLLLGVRLAAAVFSSRSRAAIRKHPFAHLLFLGVILFLWFAPWGTALGNVAARIDSSREKFRLHGASYIDNVRTRIAFCRILKDRYGIFCPPIRGCIVMSFNDIRYEQAYDRVMLSAITSYFGRDIVEECRMAARNETMQPGQP